jgi:hypothetical protein
MNWYSVRHLVAFPDGLFEERVTVWRAASFEDAIRQAELEARGYAESLNGEYLSFAQAYSVFFRSPSFWFRGVLSDARQRT